MEFMITTFQYAPAIAKPLTFNFVPIATILFLVGVPGYYKMMKYAIKNFLGYDIAQNAFIADMESGAKAIYAKNLSHWTIHTVPYVLFTLTAPVLDLPFWIEHVDYLVFYHIAALLIVFLMTDQKTVSKMTNTVSEKAKEAASVAKSTIQEIVEKKDGGDDQVSDDDDGSDVDEEEEGVVEGAVNNVIEKVDKGVNTNRSSKWRKKSKSRLPVPAAKAENEDNVFAAEA